MKRNFFQKISVHVDNHISQIHHIRNIAKGYIGHANRDKFYYSVQESIYQKIFTTDDFSIADFAENTVNLSNYTFFDQSHVMRQYGIWLGSSLIGMSADTYMWLWMKYSTDGGDTWNTPAGRPIQSGSNNVNNRANINDIVKIGSNYYWIIEQYLATPGTCKLYAVMLGEVINTNMYLLATFKASGATELTQWNFGGNVRSDGQYHYMYYDGSDFKVAKFDGGAYPGTITPVKTISEFSVPSSFSHENQIYWITDDMEFCLMTNRLYWYQLNISTWLNYFISFFTGVNMVFWDKNYLDEYVISGFAWGDAIWKITDKGVLKKIQALEPRDYKKIYLSNKNESLTGVVQFQNHNGNDAIDDWIATNLTTNITLISGHENALELTATAANGEIYYPFTTDTDSIDDIFVFIPTADQFNLKYRQTTTEVFSLSFLAGNITVTDAGGTSGTVATYTYGKWIHIKLNWIKSGALNITIDNTLAHTGTIGAFDINRLYVIIATDEKYCAIDSFGQGLNSYVAGSNKKINAYVGYGSDIGEAWFSTGDADTSIMQLSLKSVTEGTIKSLVVSEIYQAPRYALSRRTRPFEDEWIDHYTDAGKLFYGGKVKDNDNNGRFFFKYLMKSWEDEYSKTKITASLSSYTHGAMLKYVIDNFSKYLWYGTGTNGDVNEFTANQIDGTDSGWTNGDTLTCASSLVSKKGFVNDFLYDILQQLDADGGVCIVDHTVTGYTVFSGKFATSDITQQIKIEFYESATRIGYLEIAASKIRWYQGIAQDILDPAVNDTIYHWALVFSATDDDVDVYINGVFVSTESLENNITIEITKIRYTTDAVTVGPTGYHSVLYKGNSLVDAMHTYSSISPLLTTTYDFNLKSQNHPAVHKLIAEETGYIVSVRPSGQVYLDQYAVSGQAIDVDAKTGITYISKMKERNEKFSRITFYGGFVDGIQIFSEGFGEPNFGNYEDWFPTITDQSRLDAMIVKALAVRNIIIKKQILGKRGIGMIYTGTSLTYTNSHYKIASETWNSWRSNKYNGITDDNRVEIADSFLSPSKSDPQDTLIDQANANIKTNADDIVKVEQNVGQNADDIASKPDDLSDLGVTATDTEINTVADGDTAKNNHTHTASSYDLFHVYTATVYQTPASSVWTNVNWYAEEYDTGSDFNLSTDRFIVPTTGKYSFSASILWNSTLFGAGKVFIMGIYVNGVIKKIIHRNTLAASLTYSPYMGGSTELSLISADYVELKVYQNSGGEKAIYYIDATAARQYCWFTGRQVA